MPRLGRYLYLEKDTLGTDLAERTPSRTSARTRATVLADCDHSMTVLRDESFGPIIGRMPVDSDEEAIHHMNDTAPV